jgi:RluA family pseudouridine synthase
LASAIVQVGDWIEVAPPPATRMARGCEILFEDQWLLVVNKSPGITVEKENIERCVRKESFLVHRIDKDTSGILLIAKDEQTQEILEGMFRDRKIQKTYLAIVDGRLERTHGTIRHSLKFKNRYHGQACWTATDERSGKEAHTEYRRLAVQKEASLVVLLPKTGRTHQLRVHMATIGHPILGDYRYADQFRCPLRPERQFLHAWKIAFIHPMTHQPVEWTALVPEDMGKAAKVLFGRDVICVL